MKKTIQKTVLTKIREDGSSNGRYLHSSQDFSTKKTTHRHPYVSSRALQAEKNIRNLAKNFEDFLSKIIDQHS